MLPHTTKTVSELNGTPFQRQHHRTINMYLLAGQQTSILWCFLNATTVLSQLFSLWRDMTLFHDGKERNFKIPPSSYEKSLLFSSDRISRLNLKYSWIGNSFRWHRPNITNGKLEFSIQSCNLSSVNISIKMAEN